MVVSDFFVRFMPPFLTHEMRSFVDLISAHNKHVSIDQRAYEMKCGVMDDAWGVCAVVRMLEIAGWAF